jgi:microcystin degradation protein MlrC
MRIAVGGIHLESSTFTLQTTGVEDFAVRRGQELLDSFAFADWLGAERAAAIEWVPTVHAIRGASGSMTLAAWEELETELLDTLRAAGPVDGFYLAFHGACHVQGVDDAEARLARRIREIVGPDAVISASMDPHGNLSRDLAETLDLAACHRHAPHVDNEQTRERAVVNLVAVLDRGEKPAKAWVRIPALLPGERTSTVVEPGRSVFGALLPAIDRLGVLDANLYIGFAWADEPRNSAASFVTAWDPDAALACAAELAETYWGARDDFVIVVDHSGTVDEALAFVEAGAATPVVISDAGDNVTAGASGDVTHVLHAVLDRPGLLDDRRVLVAGIVDPEALAGAVAAGEGATARIAVGARIDARFGGPVERHWTVEAIVRDETGSPDGALLVDGTLSVTVQWARTPFVRPGDPAFPPGMARGRAWIDPGAYDVVVVKNGYQFPSQVELAGSAFMALTPGGTDLDVERLGIRRWSRPMYPLDTDFTPDLTPVLLGS